MGIQASEGTVWFDIASLSLYDQIGLTDTYTAGGTIRLSLLNGYVPGQDTTFHLMVFGGLVDDGYTFDFSDAALPADLSWDTSTFGSTGNLTVVPEPSTLALLGTTLLALTLAWFQKRRAA